MADKVTQMIRREWPVTRVGVLEEVVNEETGSIRFRTSIRDVGRDGPFLVRWFNDPTPAADFLDKVEAGNIPPPEKTRR